MIGRAVVLTGGVGGAKLVDGVYRLLGGNQLTAIVNTGDDFEHFGLPISPDIDTLLYTLSGKSNAKLGWGREGETWSFMAAIRSLGAEDWFNLGDGDLALHVMRGAARGRGRSLSAVTADFGRAWGLGLTILPMSDDAVATLVDCDEGTLPFQRYFVEKQCRPIVTRIRFNGAAKAVAAPGVVEAIAAADHILLAPSNPWLSIDPILAVPQIRRALEARKVPLVAVSPLIGGKAVKGPTAKIMTELGLATDNAAIAEHYFPLLDGMVIDAGDSAPAGIAVSRTHTLMQNVDDRMRVAQTALDLSRILKG